MKNLKKKSKLEQKEDKEEKEMQRFKLKKVASEFMIKDKDKGWGRTCDMGSYNHLDFDLPDDS